MRIAKTMMIAVALAAGLTMAHARQGLAQDPPRDWAAHGELVMFERDGCVWCAQWDREIGPVYPKTKEAQRFPLRRVNLDKPQAGAPALVQPIHFSPTFVLTACGRELGRIVGYPGEEHFWGLLDIEIRRLERQPARVC